MSPRPDQRGPPRLTAGFAYARQGSTPIPCPGGQPYPCRRDNESHDNDAGRMQSGRRPADVPDRERNGRCALWSSKPGEFHPQLLTEPCLRLSPHTALRNTRFPAKFLQSVTTLLTGLSRVPLVPSLHPHYRDFVATTNKSAPRWCIGISA